MCTVPISNSEANHILSVNFHVHGVLTSQQQCGANCILSVHFCEWDVCTRQQCGVNHFCSVNFHELDTRTIPDYTGACSGSPQL